MTARAADLLATARRLIATPDPSDADLRRATSTAYYALFHALAEAGADLLVGAAGSDRDDVAWIQAYRALDHRAAKDLCRDANALSRFPAAIQGFAKSFSVLQDKRHDADYDPSAHFASNDVRQDVDLAEMRIAAIAATPERDRRAFAALILFRRRP